MPPAHSTTSLIGHNIVSTLSTTSSSFIVNSSLPTEPFKVRLDFGDRTEKTNEENLTWISHIFKETGLFKVAAKLMYGNMTLLETRRFVRVMAQIWPPQMTCPRYVTRGTHYSCGLNILRGSRIKAEVFLPFYGLKAMFSLQGILLMSLSIDIYNVQNRPFHSS